MGPVAITARFPLGVYHGHGDDGAPDPWPSPARLFSALVSAARTGTTATPEGAPSHEAEAALTWLEEHPPSGLRMPPTMAVHTARRARVAYRDTGVMEKKAPKKGTKPISEGVAVAGGFAWIWDEMPTAVQEALTGLCADIPHLGEADSVAVFEVETGVEPTLRIDEQATAFTPGGLRLPVPVPGRAKVLADLHAKTADEGGAGHQFLGFLLTHRDRIKLKQMVDSLSATVASDGRIHTTFSQVAAATGRLASADPNLQNIPARSADGMRIRGAFVAGEDFESLMSADYSQIEMRLMAHLSGDEALIEAFNSGEDLHRTMASMVFGTPVAEVTGEERSRIKATSYGLAYGLSSYGLAAQLGIPVPEAAALRDRYFERFGKVRDYLEGLVAQARADGYTQTMFGRRRYLPDLRSSNRQRREMAERAALNAPIQGSAADIVKIAMMNVADALSEAGLVSRLLVQIHDELLLEVAPGEAAAVEALVREKMATPVELSVPLDVAVGIGTSWQLAAH